MAEKIQTKKKIAELVGAELQSNDGSAVNNTSDIKKSEDIEMKDNVNPLREKESENNSKKNKLSQSYNVNNSNIKENFDNSLDIVSDNEDEDHSETGALRRNLNAKNKCKKRKKDNDESQGNSPRIQNSQLNERRKAPGSSSDISVQSDYKKFSEHSKQVWYFTYEGVLDPTSTNFYSSLRLNNLANKTFFRIGYYVYERKDKSKQTIIIFKYTTSGRISRSWYANEPKFKLLEKPREIKNFELEIRCGYYTGNETLLHRHEEYSKNVLEEQKKIDKDIDKKREIIHFDKELEGVDSEPEEDNKEVNKKIKSNKNKLTKVVNKKLNKHEDEKEEDKKEDEKEEDSKKKGKKNKKAIRSKTKSRKKDKAKKNPIIHDEDNNSNDNSDNSKRNSYNLRSRKFPPTWEEDAKKVDNKAKNKGNDQKKDKQGLITNYFKKEDDIGMDSDS